MLSSSDFEAARKRALAEITEIRESIHSVVKDEVASIFGSHLQILNDPKLLDEIRDKISSKRYTGEYAVSRVFRKVIKVFQEIQDAYFSQRVNDFYDIQKRLLRNLLGQKAEDLQQAGPQGHHRGARFPTPSQTATLDKAMVVGFATDAGGATSHTAILANALHFLRCCWRALEPGYFRWRYCRDRRQERSCHCKPRRRNPAISTKFG